MITTGVFDMVPKSKASQNQRIHHAVWNHQHKSKPAGKVYCHKSKICTDDSTQQKDIDFNETYFPVVQ
eukprot:9940741-Ditylum_brightwellii.AAC.1